MSILESIKQAEQAASEAKKAAAANARDIIHDAEAEADEIVASAIEEARTKAALEIAKAQEAADDQARSMVEKSSLDNAKVSQDARSRLPQAVAEITDSVIR